MPIPVVPLVAQVQIPAFRRADKAKLRPCSRVDAVDVGGAAEGVAAADVVAADLSDCDHEPFL